MDDTLANFKHHLFYHGTSLEAAERIVQQGFRTAFHDEEIGWYCAAGNLGSGVYVTCNWRTALWFGSTLLRVAMRPGTKILNTSLPPDSRVLQYLQREFGRDILKQPPWQVIPQNKQLRLSELITLVRYHYWHTWERPYGTDADGFTRWPQQRVRHAKHLSDLWRLLRRYGLHGYGNPDDDNGIVVFAGDRLSVVEVVAEVPAAEYRDVWKSAFHGFSSLEDVRALLRTRGSAKAKRLAKRIAKVNVEKPRR